MFFDNETIFFLREISIYREEIKKKGFSYL